MDRVLTVFLLETCVADPVPPGEEGKSQGNGKHRGLASHGIYSGKEAITREEYGTLKARQRVGGSVDEGD